MLTPQRRASPLVQELCALSPGLCGYRRTFRIVAVTYRVLSPLEMSHDQRPIGPSRIQLARAIASRDGLWLERFSDPRAFGRVCEQYSVPTEMGRRINALWTQGLLCADFVEVNREIGSPPPGLHLVQEQGRWAIYSDSRPLRGKKDGFAGSLEEWPPLPPGVSPKFHPFRFLVVRRLARQFEPFGSSPFRTMHPREGSISLAASLFDSAASRTSGEAFLKQVRAENDLAAFLVMCEPILYPYVVGTRSIPFELQDSPEQHQALLDQHSNELRTCFRRAGVQRLRSLHSELVRDSEMADSNTDIHTLLRLGSGNLRRKTKGAIGIAVLLRACAEMVRRGIARFLEVEQPIPEEDEVGFAVWTPGIKERIYGSERIVDGPASAKSAFLRQISLDYATTLRWYVEGATEYGAISTAVQALGLHHVEVIDLKAQVVEKGVVAFRESLRRDKRAQILSFIMLDSDRDDWLRALRRAAKDDEIVGRVIISKPDIEICNFTTDELVDVLRTVPGCETLDRDRLVEATRGCDSGKSFFECVHAADNNIESAKGEAWGAALMRYALGPTGDARERPLVDSVFRALRARASSYRLFVEKYRVCEHTLRTIPRD